MYLHDYISAMEDFFPEIYFPFRMAYHMFIMSASKKVATFEELLWRNFSLHIFHLLDSERRNLNLNAADIFELIALVPTDLTCLATKI